MLYIQKLWWWLRTQIFLRIRVPHINFFSYVASPLFILGGHRIFISKKVRIFPGARMEVHQKGLITIEEGVSIGQNFHITSAKCNLCIGANTTILGNVFITNIDHEYQEIGVHILKQPYKISQTNIGENCFIGYGAAIQAGTILGKQCIIGAHSVVRGTFPDYCVIVGAPARIVKRYNLTSKKWERTTPDGSFLQN